MQLWATKKSSSWSRSSASGCLEGSCGEEPRSLVVVQVTLNPTSRMATTSQNPSNVVKLNYASKDWFKTICGLNDTGLVPGQTLTEDHISKQDCIFAFGDQKANNGYKVGKNSKFRDRVIWLWKRVHQADRPPNNDVGLRFCQGILYEDRHGLDTVNWAQFAENTVKWFQNSKGLTKVHDDWAYAYPSIIIDVVTGKSVCALHPTRPIQRNLLRTFKVPTTLSPSDARKRKVEHFTSHPSPTIESEANKSGLTKGMVKLEYIPRHVSLPSAEIPQNHPCQKASVQTEEVPSTEGTSTPDILSPRASTDFEEVLVGCTQTPEILSQQVPSQKIPNPKTSTDSKERPLECTPAFLNALQLFQVDIERAVSVSVKDLEEQKNKLKNVLDHHRHDVDVATATIKDLMKELESAEMVLSVADTDDNCGEVRCIQSAIKSGKNKLNSKKAKYGEILSKWRLQVQLLTEKSQAQKIIETHFRLKDEEDQPFGS